MFLPNPATPRVRTLDGTRAAYHTDDKAVGYQQKQEGEVDCFLVLETFIPETDTCTKDNATVKLHIYSILKGVDRGFRFGGGMNGGGERRRTEKLRTLVDAQ